MLDTFVDSFVWSISSSSDVIKMILSTLYYDEDLDWTNGDLGTLFCSSIEVLLLLGIVGT
jgi:hypothetical protein